MKIALLLVISIGLTGCTLFTPKIKTVYETKYVPLVMVPTAPVIARPPSAVAALSPTERMDDGAFARAVALDDIYTESHIEKLELILGKYNQLSKISIIELIQGVPSSAEAQLSWYSNLWNRWIDINKDMDSLTDELK